MRVIKSPHVCVIASHRFFRVLCVLPFNYLSDKLKSTIQTRSKVSSIQTKL